MHLAHQRLVWSLSVFFLQFFSGACSVLFQSQMHARPWHHCDLFTLPKPKIGFLAGLAPWHLPTPPQPVTVALATLTLHRMVPAQNSGRPLS